MLGCPKCENNNLNKLESGGNKKFYLIYSN